MLSFGFVPLFLCRVFPKFYLFSRYYFPVCNIMNTQTTSSTVLPSEDGSFLCNSISFLMISSNFSSKPVKVSIFNATFSSISKNPTINLRSESNHSETSQLQEHPVLGPKQTPLGFARFVPPGFRSTTSKPSQEPNHSFANKESIMWSASQSTKKPEPFFVPSSKASQSGSLPTTSKSINLDPSSSSSSSFSFSSLKPTSPSPSSSSSSSSPSSSIDSSPSLVSTSFHCSHTVPSDSFSPTLLSIHSKPDQFIQSNIQLIDFFFFFFRSFSSIEHHRFARIGRAFHRRPGQATFLPHIFVTEPAVAGLPSQFPAGSQSLHSVSPSPSASE